MIPLVDFPNGRGHVPVVNYLLILANVAVFLLIAVPLWWTRPVNGPELAAYVHGMGAHLTRPEELRALVRDLTAYDLYLFAHGFRPAAPSLRALFGSMFLHAGPLQLAGNMLVLWIFGDNLEHRLGSLRYLLAYLASGVTATSVYWAMVPGAQMPIVGAAGAICGVLGLYFVFFPCNRVRLLWLLPPLRVFEVPARLVLGIYLVLDNLVPFLLGSSDAGVACAAHAAAFAGGVAGARLVEWRALAAAPRDAAPRSSEQALGLAAALRSQGRSDAALAVVRRLLRDEPSAAAGAAAHLLAGQILFTDQDQAASAYPHLLAAVARADTPQIADAARAVLAEIEARQKRRIGTPYGPRAATEAAQAGAEARR